MPYLGNDLQVANTTYRVIDDISSGFNGSTTSFALTVQGLTPVPFPVNEQNCLISVGGVPQKPDYTGTEGFKFSGSNIVFSSAPAAGEKFWGVILAGADYVAAGVTYPNGTANTPSITFGSNTSTGLFLSGTNVLGIATGGVQAVTVDSAQRVGIGTANPQQSLHVSGSGNIYNRVSSTTSTFTGVDFGQSSSGDGVIDVRDNKNLILYTNDTERVRITSTGAISPGATGTNTGTTGQALLSQGASSPPTWGTVSSAATVQTFTSSGTWTKPSTGTVARIYLWGGGGSGGRTTVGGGGGGGGACIFGEYLLSSLPSTVTVTIGSGGSVAAGTTNTNGAAGQNSTFGSLLTAYGGGPGGGTASSANSTGGGGGGLLSAGTLSTAGTGYDSSTAGGQGFTSPGGGSANLGGAGGGFGGVGGGYAGGKALYGGGGGGAHDGTTGLGAGGTSVFGGNGGTAQAVGSSGQAGAQPGGGGSGCDPGGVSVSPGAGGDGQCIVFVY